MFTKQHFQALAAILKAERVRIDHESSKIISIEQYKVVDHIEQELMDVFRFYNQRFDRQRFLDASR